MLGIHMFGDVQAFEQEIANPWHPLSNQELEQLEGFSTKEFADAMLLNAYGAYAFDRELTGTDAYADLITLIENRHGDWAYRILDRYTVQALWSRADEHGAHNALELIEAEIASENI